MFLCFAEVQECFSLFDKDGDGSIAAREVGPVLRSLGYNPAEAEINKLVEDVDSEGKERTYTQNLPHLVSSYFY